MCVFLFKIIAKWLEDTSAKIELWLFFVRKKQQQPKIQRTKNTRKIELHPLKFAFKIQCEIAWEKERKLAAITVATVEVVIVGAVTATDEQKRSNNRWITVVWLLFVTSLICCQMDISLDKIQPNTVFRGARGWCNQNRTKHIATAKKTKLFASLIDRVHYYLLM